MKMVRIPTLAAVALVSSWSSSAVANPCNPCAANPCNPCGGGAMMGPIDPAAFSQPDGAELRTGKAKRGLKLWSDRSLSGDNSTSCATCHTEVAGGPYNMMKASFAQDYPHSVDMAVMRAGKKSVNAAEMVNFCMLVPMKAETLDCDSKELADLVAYVESVQDGFDPSTVPATPMNACNPCGGAMNACNPCGGAMNACNPCGDQPANACNPCGG